MDECIFCKIIAGEIPSHKVYEDEKTLAFLDIHPLQTGHTLVIPKKHEPHFEQLDEQDYSELMTIVKKVAKTQKESLGKERICLRVEGFDVPHAHVHVYPADSPEEFYGDDNRNIGEPDHEKLSETAQKLRFE